MRCGAKRFIVQYELDSELIKKEVIARSPMEARKKVKASCQQPMLIVNAKRKS